MMAALLKERLRMRLLKISGPDFSGRNVRGKLSASRMVYRRRIAYTACPHGLAASGLAGDGTHLVEFRSTCFCGSALNFRVLGSTVFRSDCCAGRKPPVTLRVRCSCCSARLSFSSSGRMLRAVSTMESSMSKAGLDNRHRNKDGEISHKHGNTLIRTLRRIYGQSFAAGYPDTEKLSEVLVQLNETSLSQLRRDHETGHLEHKIANASK
jgi:hypothetical protein